MCQINNHRKTKIIATLGPACQEEETFLALLEAGVDVIRINASHAKSIQDIKGKVSFVREVSSKVERYIPIFVDLQGPKIRVGSFKEGSVELETGQDFVFYKEEKLGDKTGVSFGVPELIDDIQLGEMVFVDDGKVLMKVTSKAEDHLVCQVTRGGTVSDHKGVNLPQTDLTVAALTDKDREDAKAAVEAGVDYIALSFVKAASDVKILRECIDEIGENTIQIISKIERPQAVRNMDEIIDVSDAIMVARGDLGVEIGFEQVPRVQKMIVRRANYKLKPVIVATQMLETMISKPVATRAEVSDVANAIYDRCDAVMLSGETAIGVDPVAAVKTMSDICKASDSHLITIRKDSGRKYDEFEVEDLPVSMCKSADHLAEVNNLQLILAFTSSGSTPLIASKLNPVIPILAPTDLEYVYRRGGLYRGVTMMMMPQSFKSIHRWTDMINLAVEEAKKMQYLNSGDRIIVMAGRPIGESNGLNSIRVITVK